MQSQMPLKPRPHGAGNKYNTDRSQSADQPPVTHGYVRSFDGTKLFYSIEGSGKPLVFCYGLVCTSLHWTYQIDHFQRDHRAIWFDYRGHHNSEVPTDLSSLNIDSMAKDLGAVFDELN